MCCKLRFFWSGTWIILVGLFFLPVLAQEDSTTPIITIENIQHLQSVAQLDFAAIPAEFGTFDAGWFALSQYGERVALVNAEGSFVMATITGDIDTIYSQTSSDDLPARAIDAVVSDTTPADDRVVFRDSRHYYVMYADSGTLTFQSENTPQTLWRDSEHLYLELIPPAILQLPNQFIPVDDPNDARESGYLVIPYLPAEDSEAVVRIGRVEPPYVVTSSATGVIRLWNIQEASLLVETHNGTGKPSVFGNINASATHLVWRDELSESLYLLDFMASKNRKIADLDGKYVQWFFLSADTSVILGVNMDFEPHIIAWDTTTGEKTILGEYRQCSRPQPDMARLSQDGTTLVIGCDTGLDFWRIHP
jgi:hypothetical protein